MMVVAIISSDENLVGGRCPAMNRGPPAKSICFQSQMPGGKPDKLMASKP
jgi:hypothetical protein